jgi:2-C-methyl-D-erythritol 4-phosphate cytidylyltransferase
LLNWHEWVYDIRMYRGNKVGAIVVAAGDSRRMKGVDKIWAPIAGKPVLFWVLSTFQNNPYIDKVIVVIKKENYEFYKELIKQQFNIDFFQVCPGGERRQDSVLYGLNQLNSHNWVIIHDGARPLLDNKLIEQGLEAAQETGAAIAAVPVVDTVKKATKTMFVKQTLVRKQLWSIQTPQIFQYDILTEAYQHIGNNVTDDSTLVEKIGHKVKIYTGSYDNIKITTPENIILAECLIKQRYGI